jgi:hypothetical protein
MNKHKHEYRSDGRSYCYCIKCGKNKYRIDDVKTSDERKITAVAKEIDKICVHIEKVGSKLTTKGLVHLIINIWEEK